MGKHVVSATNTHYINARHKENLMIQLQRLNPEVTDEDGFARSGIRSYHEYLILAKLPEVEGVSDRVLEALQKRIGHAPMAIEHIANDLNLSKRTLQRRLQHQGASFAQLRDSLRRSEERRVGEAASARWLSDHAKG